ncbi:MAG: iron ABC transporter permease [Candidatus Eremiobacteraeota bacterium]|nr:iron ABC transporter permease [Candidatus Eremiobacteraeota bacterium]NNM92111.1 iron ABC transporter permease [Candidatus Eremiobacteraeota bacterium]
MFLRRLLPPLAATIAAGVGLAVGGDALPLSQVVHALANPHAHDIAHTILWQLRMPRVLCAALVGSALALAGVQLQGMLRNPLVDPYLIGTSAGAAAAIAVALALGVALSLLPALGFVGGLAASLLVAALARRGGGIDATRIILAGVAISALLAASVALLSVLARSISFQLTLQAWLVGSLAGRGWNDLRFALPYAIVGALVAIGNIRSLDALRIGDLRARGIGLDIERAQWSILGSATLLTAAAVSLAGMVGFVGLIVPHLARRIVGSDARALLPASAFLGAAMAIAADAIARAAIAPRELPLGIVLAFAGIPIFIVIYLRREQRR